MVLYRPRMADYHEAMRHIKIFDEVQDLNRYVVNFHNLYNIAAATKTDFLLHGDGREMNDERNGWKHSRYIFLGNTPLGIFDSSTLRDIKKPRLQIKEDDNGGLSCQFQLTDKEYIFFLGIGLWQTTSQCQGFLCRQMGHPIFRKDDIPITREAFTQLLTNFIAETAIREIQTAEKATQLRNKTNTSTTPNNDH
ncbi:hypothetical protein [Anaerovibrio sp. JC8]|uniref:hypothetical protein n=1 Tax=Anaerovibrio sp. JC8 TaxID=1240085 RepID=UPI000A0F9A5E|nr:hypothetical protein [Anaerovibrio sp. JC8]